jgi:hypothetical protein
LGGGGDVEPARLSQETGVATPDLEATLLRFQEHGHLTYRALGGREFLLELLPAPADTIARLQMTLAHRAKGAKHRAEAMLAYARDHKCRHGQVARYFGDRWPNLPCGSCDVCAGAAEKKTGRGRVSVAASVSARPEVDASAPPVDPATAPLAALQIVHDLASGYRPWAMGKTGLMRAVARHPGRAHQARPHAGVRGTRRAEEGRGRAADRGFDRARLPAA